MSLTKVTYSMIDNSVLNVKDFGADPTGTTDSTLAITAAAMALQNGQTLDFDGGTYLVSYQGTPYSSAFGNVIMSFLNKRDMKFVGNNATIKIVDHNITTYGGLTFMSFKGCKRITIEGFNFDMTFVGSNTSGSFYPFCGAITMLDDNGASPDFETLNSDFLIDGCSFKLYHPWGNWATSPNPYSGDPNNGYKLFSIFSSGPYTATDYNNQCRNISVINSTWRKGHNGYGIWFWAWNNCRVSNCVAEDWVTMHTDQTGAYQGGGVAFIRHIPFRTEGIVIENNNFRARPTADRTGAFQGGSVFYVHANNMGDVDWARGLSVVANNTIILGVGSLSGTAAMDQAVFFNGFGQLIVDGNTIDGHDGQDPTVAGVAGLYAMELTPAGYGGAGNGYAAITVTNNILGSWLFGGIYFTNGASTEYRRRCKSLVVANNTQLSGDFFLRTVAYSYQAYEGCRQMLICNNVIDTVNPGVYPSPSTNNYGIAIAATQSSDVVICSGNIIKNRTYTILTQSAYCSASAKVSRFNNKYSDIASPYYSGTNVFPFDAIDGNPSVIARSSDGSYQPLVRCINEYSTPVEIQMYQQATSSYIIASNDLHTYTDGADQTITDSNVFRPAADNTKTLGNASFRWSVVYAGTGTINTSDERSKEDIQDIDAAVLRAWGKVDYTQFKFKDAVAAKGNGARWHFGLIAQRVKEAFKSEGLDAFAYGILCYDKWDDQYVDELVEVEEDLGNGKTIKKMQGTGNKVLSQSAGDRYGIRYEEALALECAYLRSKLK